MRKNLQFLPYEIFIATNLYILDYVQQKIQICGAKHFIWKKLKIFPHFTFFQTSNYINDFFSFHSFLARMLYFSFNPFLEKHFLAKRSGWKSSLRNCMLKNLRTYEIENTDTRRY